MSLVRFCISIPAELSNRFDKLIHKKKYGNRSEAIRDLIRRSLIEEEITNNRAAIGILSLLYNHHKRELSEKLTQLQHLHHQMIISTMHIHLDQDNCVEVIILEGNSRDIKNLGDTLIATKGVKHGEIHLTSTGKNLK
jgi:CopG family nickel-responsive transcriptional regulator